MNKQPEATGNRVVNSFFMILFGLSGAVALIYQVLWARQFVTVLGSSMYSVAIILASFMTGLGIGAKVIGSLADRLTAQKLAIYYLCLEIGIGVYALALPFLLSLTDLWFISFCRAYDPSIVTVNTVRIVYSFVLLLIPTTLMGGTLPVMSRYILRYQLTIPMAVSRLYGINTLGGIAGVVAGGFFLVPAMGIAHTNQLAAAINILVGILFFTVHSNISGYAGHRVPISDGAAPPLNRQEKIMLWSFALSGAAAMGYEVAWTRTLSLILGSTTYAFSIMLATFLSGIAIGSFVYIYLQKVVKPVTLFIGLQFIVAISVLITLPAFEKLPFVFLSLHSSFAETWIGLQGIRLVICFAVMIVPTLCLGILFPVVSSALAGNAGIIGKRLGIVSSFNTFGCVVGAICAGLIIIPWAGMQSTIMAGAALNLTAGILVLITRLDLPVTKRITVSLCAGGLIWVLIMSIAPWSPKIMNSGVHIYAKRYQDIIKRVEAVAGQYPKLENISSWTLWEQAMKQFELIYYDIGPVNTVSVMKNRDGVTFMTVNGKTDASTGDSHDMKTQVMLGQLPLLLHKKPDRIFLVGLGSGITAGSILTHDIRVMDCAEISPSVIKAASYFSGANHNALADPRLKLVSRDARNSLLTSGEKYDVVVSQPSNPWIEGQSSLFSYEWYKTVKKHLKKEGIFAQWLPAYYISRQNLKIMINTLSEVFPHLSAWSSGSRGDLIFIARKGGPLKIDYPDFRQTINKEKIRNDIQRIGCSVETLLKDMFLMNEDDIIAYLNENHREKIPKNTDDLLVTEFSTPVDKYNKVNVAHFSEKQFKNGFLKKGLGDIINR